MLIHLVFASGVHMTRSSAWVRRLKRSVLFGMVLPLLGCGGDDTTTSVQPSATKAISAFTVSSDEQVVVPPGTAYGSDIPDEHLSFLR